MRIRNDQNVSIGIFVLIVENASKFFCRRVYHVYARTVFFFIFVFDLKTTFLVSLAKR